MDKLNKLSSQSRICQLMNSSRFSDNIWRRITSSKDQHGLIELNFLPVYLYVISGNELAPIDDDWIYYKVASLARKIYIRPRAGVRLLSHIQGGLYRGKCRSERHQEAGTKVIRWGLQQLEKQKIIKKDKKGDSLKINSRIVTDEGRGTLNRIVTEHIKARTAWANVMMYRIFNILHLCFYLSLRWYKWFMIE